MDLIERRKRWISVVGPEGEEDDSPVEEKDNDEYVLAVAINTTHTLSWLCHCWLESDFKQPSSDELLQSALGTLILKKRATRKQWY